MTGQMQKYGYKNVAMSAEAAKAVHELVVLMTRKYGRRFTISSAIIQAVADLKPKVDPQARRKALDL